MNTTRRDLFKFAGGAAVGALLTPAPWRLIKDTSLWSENWPGIPQPRRGAFGFRYTNCSLCGAGCAVRARCVGQQPVAMAGVAGHPLSHGALCVYGIAGHHPPYHPARLKSGPVSEAMAAVSDAIAHRGAHEHVAVFDLRPGRTHSWTYRRALAGIGNGLYVVPERQPHPSVAVNLAAAKTVLSFGTPLLDSWGTPGNVVAARRKFRLIQAEPVESRTAMLADLWLPVRPGSEEALALAIANRLLENGAPAKDLPAGFRERARLAAAQETGIADQQIRALARELVEDSPAVVLAASGSPDILSLNWLLEALGRTIVSRRETPVPDGWKKAVSETELGRVPDASLRVLLIDESAPGNYMPWSAIEPKLAPGAVVATFAWTRDGYGRHAKYVLPAPVFPEGLDDVPAAVDSVTAVFRLTGSLLAVPAAVVNPADFIGKLAGVDAAGALRERADAISKVGRGSVFTYADNQTVPLRRLKPDEFWKALNEGACWIDDPDPKAPAPPLDFALPPAYPVAMVEDRGSAALASPLLSKLHEESRLRMGRRMVALDPSCGFPESARAMLETDRGRIEVEVTIDSSLPPGMVQVAAGPEVFDLCGGASHAKVVRL
jgi:molybdopterin-dependent oxidoreductase iron-sulfur protein